MTAPLREDYIRVKRKNQIFFIHTSPSDTFGHIKAEIAIAMSGEDAIAPKNMRLYIDVAASSSFITTTKKDDNGGDEQVGIGNNQKSVSPEGPIPDTALLSDYKVMNDLVMYVTFANDGVADSWEEIDIVKP